MFSGNKKSSYFSSTSQACPICGNDVPVGVLFCDKCGMRVQEHQFQEPHNKKEQLNTMRSTSGMELHHSAAASTYGLQTLSENPTVKAVIGSCKETLSASYPDINRFIDDYQKRVLNDIKDIVSGDAIDLSMFESLGISFIEERDFGLGRCTEAAKKIFNPDVIMCWGNLSVEQRMQVSGTYAKEVAESFELVLYNGVEYEEMKKGVWGYNTGNGVLYLSNALMEPLCSPLKIIDTITHELRHQYQNEAVIGYHNVCEQVVNEWKVAFQIYNDGEPCCYNPWGYRYNPVEIDARYAGETVVRNLSHDLFNAKSAIRKSAISIQQLKKRLAQEGYTGLLLEQTAGDLLKLDGKAAEMLNSWLDNGIRPDFDDIEGVNSRLLREQYRMKEPAIILSYGMLLNNPVHNSSYLKKLLSRGQIHL